MKTSRYNVVLGGLVNDDPEYLIVDNAIFGGTAVLSLRNPVEAQTVCDYLNTHGAGRLSAAEVHDIQVARQKYADILAQLRLVAVRLAPITMQVGSWTLDAKRSEPMRTDLADLLMAELEEVYDELLGLGFDAGPLPPDISDYLSREALETSIPKMPELELSDG